MCEKSCAKSRRSRSNLVLLLAGACMVAAGGVAVAGPAPKVAGNLAVNGPQAPFPQGNPTRSTSSIAASADGRDLLVAFEDLQGLCGMAGGLKCTPNDPPGLTAYSFSTDGGVTWTDAGALPALDTNISAGHPWVDRLTRSGRGRGSDTYFLVTRIQDGTTGLPTGLGIYRGHFAAGTFTVDDGQVLAGANPAGNEDSRPEIAAAKDGSANAYISQVNVDEICNVPYAGFGQIELWYTHDGGDTWNGPVVVGPETSFITDPANPNCGNMGYMQISPDVAIGPHGEVYVVWEYGPEFFPDFSNTPTSAVAFGASFDGGKTFTKPLIIEPLNAMRENPPVGYAKNRMNDQPRIAVATSGPYRGRIYVTSYPAVAPTLTGVTQQSLTSSQAYIAYSDDRGRTWSTPATITAPVPATGVKQLWPTVSVRPDGAVDVVYLESQETPTGTPCSVATGPKGPRTGPASSLVDTFWVQSRDGGATFSAPLRVSTETSDWCTAPYMFDAVNLYDGFLVSNAGDYFGSLSILGRTLTVWPDDRGGPMDTFFGQVNGEVTGPHHGPGAANP